jgi:hemerythrin
MMKVDETKPFLKILEAETMSVTITWKDFYSVGDPLLDTQHKQIIDAINELYEAMQNNSPQEVIKPILNRLVQYTFNHFKYEEETLQAIEYPDYLEHKALHDKMRKQTFDLKKNADLVTGNILLKFLKEWWVVHIQSEDKKYKPYLELTESHP